MRIIYVIVMAACWAVIAHEFHWPLLMLAAVNILPLTFAWYLSRVIEDDK